MPWLNILKHTLAKTFQHLKDEIRNLSRWFILKILWKMNMLPWKRHHQQKQWPRNLDIFHRPWSMWQLLELIKACICVKFGRTGCGNYITRGWILRKSMMLRKQYFCFEVFFSWLSNRMWRDNYFRGLTHANWYVTFNYTGKSKRWFI